MLSIKKHSKGLASIFMLMVLLQSCAGYGPPVTMQEAVRSSERTRVKYTNDVIHRYDVVTEENGTYYGMSKQKGKAVKTKIETTDLENVRLYSPSRTALNTVLMPVAVVGVVVGVILLTGGPSISVGL